MLLAGEEGALELRRVRRARATATSGPRCVRQIAAEIAQHGGTATEREGAGAPSCVCLMPVRLPDGSAGHAAVRGSSASTARAGCCARRCSASPAVEPDEDGDVGGRAARRRRASAAQHAMPPGDPLPLTLPPRRPAVDLSR